MNCCKHWAFPVREPSRRFACVALAFALLQMPQPLAAQRRLLDSADVRTWAGLLRAHDARARDTIAIDAALHSNMPELRAAAARIVGMNRVASRYAILRGMLRAERDSSVASDAAFALGLATDSLSCDALRGALARPAAMLAAAGSLGELGTRCGVFGALLDRAHSSVVRAALLRVSVKWTPFPDSVVSAAYARTAVPGERWAALYAFSRARRTAGAPFAIAASHDRDPRTREVAARLLASTIQPAESATRIVARLDSLLTDSAPHVRVAAVRSIASWKSLALAPLERAWSHEADENVRVTMAQTVGKVATDTAAIWSLWWKADTTHMVRRSLIASAWEAGAISALQSAAGDSLAANPDFRLRIAMIDGAASKNTESELRAIVSRFADSDARVRAAVVSALAGADPAARDAAGFPALRDSAGRDTDIEVRAEALAARSKSASASDVSSALDGYVRAATDSTSSARNAALSLIDSAWRRDSAGFSDSVRTRLQQLSPAVDPQLRARVTGVTPLEHWKSAPSPASPPLSEYERIVRTVVAPSLNGRPPVLVISTSRGPIRIMLDGVRTPMTVDHLSRLAKAGYFRNLRFHRVVPAFVAQGGDPRGDGSGGPGYSIRDELNRSPYVRGAVGMALSGPDTGGSQFFLTLAPQPHLDGHYTVFGRVVAGQIVVDALTQGDAIVNILSVPQ